MKKDALARLASRRQGERGGLVSVCSAHPVVIEAALAEAAAHGAFALIEATCNQVNHQGGYSGLTPAAFEEFVRAIAEKSGFPGERLILGGDHLGPYPWRHLPAAQAMAEAEKMVRAYAAAGFVKLHLDCSMGCADDPIPLSDAEVAERAARLAAAAEAAAGGNGVHYVIGTEVPPPGGARERLLHLTPTRPEAARATVEAHRAAFASLAPAAWGRVIALVVQPGVEFSDTAISLYDRARAAALTASREALGGLVFEAHSTDYQPASALAALVEDGFAILKVGPALTFALREALYGLDAIAAALGHPGPRLPEVMERLMQEDPRHWQGHYQGSPLCQRLLRHFAYSDRIRYYWPHPEARRAVEALLGWFGERDVPGFLLRAHLPHLHARLLAEGTDRRAPALLMAAVREALRPYYHAVAL
jgi:D-tagatose-bisphosphate aldolase class II non-catalytic subunit